MTLQYLNYEMSYSIENRVCSSNIDSVISLLESSECVVSILLTFINNISGNPKNIKNVVRAISQRDDSLLRTLSIPTSYHKLDYGHCKPGIGFFGCKMLTNIVHNLDYLDLSGHALGFRGFKIIIESLNANPIELKMRNCGLNQEHFDFLCFRLLGGRKRTKSKYRHIKDKLLNKIEDFAKFNYDSLYENVTRLYDLDKCVKIRSLDIRDTYVVYSMKFFDFVLMFNRTLETIKLSAADRMPQFFALEKYNATLKAISISGLLNPVSHYNFLSNVWKSSHLQTIKMNIFRFGHTMFTQDDVPYDVINNLFGKSNITNVGLWLNFNWPLSKKLTESTHLKRLYLNDVTSNQGVLFGNVIPHNAPFYFLCNLEILKLRAYAKTLPSYFTDRLCSFIKSETCKMWKMQIDVKMDYDQFKALCEALMNNHTVSHLALNINICIEIRERPKGEKLLLDVIRNNSNIVEIRLLNHLFLCGAYNKEARGLLHRNRVRKTTLNSLLTTLL